ncbi:hypothetical protein CCACVL1_29290 [Corchorus capsularis]|uniref:Stress induced protein n=1 Tax=Corchorus capsularis TaxID=210143 RepID=A0A1R3G2I5_COCAP|nr:hypothetical protein CCACVL1_29290 [Corchorus capsularis]
MHKQGDEVDEDEVWDNGCDWCSLFCLKRRRETDSLLHHGGDNQTAAETWWKHKLKKVKQVSEKVAGPKWKNFIRKMSGYFNKRKAQKNRFQYDPYSYALNFDNSDDNGYGGDEYLVHQDFPHRFAPPFADDQKQRAGS